VSAENHREILSEKRVYSMGKTISPKGKRSQTPFPPISLTFPQQTSPPLTADRPFPVFWFFDDFSGLSCFPPLAEIAPSRHEARRKISV
jgi:hypothetical protein